MFGGVRLPLIIHVMKKIVLLLILLICSVLIVKKIGSSKDKLCDLDNTEALASPEEGLAIFCRCHSSDGSCQRGSYISLRPSCGTFFSQEPFYYDCSILEVNCE